MDPGEAPNRFYALPTELRLRIHQLGRAWGVFERLLMPRVRRWSSFLRFRKDLRDSEIRVMENYYRRRTQAHEFYIIPPSDSSHSSRGSYIAFQDSDVAARHKLYEAMELPSPSRRNRRSAHRVIAPALPHLVSPHEPRGFRRRHHVLPN